MTDKYLPGPWVLDHCGDRSIYSPSAGDGNGGLVCMVEVWDQLRTDTSGTMELLRSAPEMADKLKAIRKIVDRKPAVLANPVDGFCTCIMRILEGQTDGD